jgi:hypothetical protein
MLAGKTVTELMKDKDARVRLEAAKHSFTLDTNCLIAIDEGRPEAGAIRTLAHAHSLGKADVAVVAISASEKQKSGHYIQNFTEFRDRLASLGGALRGQRRGEHRRQPQSQ